MNTGNQTTHHPLDPSLILRTAGMADLTGVVDLIYAVCAADGDTSVATTPDEMASSWQQAGFHLETDAWVVQTSAGQLVGYAEVLNNMEHAHLSGDMYIHPDFKNCGIHAALLQAMENRGRKHIPLAADGARVYIRTVTDHRDEIGIANFQQAGHSPIRYYWRMGIELSAAPQIPALRPGLQVRPFQAEEHAQAVLQARNEAFASHWGSHPLSFERFSYYYFDQAEYDPGLWVNIWDGEKLAGFCINHLKMGIGWVRTLGVRPAWRGQGLGLALLLRSFSAFHQRGMSTIGLSVDAANPTGATRLYQKAGMQVMSQFIMFEKELRPGTEPAYQLD